MKKVIAKEDLQRFGVVCFKKGKVYQFEEIVVQEGVYYQITTPTGPVSFREKDFKRMFYTSSGDSI